MAMGIRKVGDDRDSVYDTAWYRESVVKAERGNREHIAKYDRSFNGIMAKADRDDANDDDRDDDGNASDHPIVQLATLLVASGKFSNHAQALDHLLNSPHGNALLARLTKAEAHTGKDHSTMDRATELRDIEKLEAVRVEKLEQLAKSSGVFAVAKHVLAEGPSGLTNADFNRMCNADWQRDRRSGESYDQCFARHYSAPDAMDVRKADQMLKSMPFVADLTPLVVGGEANRGGDVNPNDPSEAIAQLKQLGRDRWPTESESQQFERALTDPVNHKLARQAVPIPRATTSFPYPR
jgi:hypothetical protein